MRARAMAICAGARAGGIALSVDPNIRPEVMSEDGYLRDVRALMGMADYVLPSDADAGMLFPGQAFSDWSGDLLKHGAKVVALKRGDRGALVRDAKGTADLPGHRVEVVDPTGAGDCFCATLVTLLAGGMDMARAAERANAAGALAVQRLGPMEGNSTLPEIEAFLRARQSVMAGE
jgi:sugar/nucleoside kinase (ribokinase family)